MYQYCGGWREERNIFTKHLNRALTIFKGYRGIEPVNSDRFQKKAK